MWGWGCATRLFVSSDARDWRASLPCSFSICPLSLKASNRFRERLFRSRFYSVARKREAQAKLGDFRVDRQTMRRREIAIDAPQQTTSPLQNESRLTKSRESRKTKYRYRTAMRTIKCKQTDLPLKPAPPALRPSSRSSSQTASKTNADPRPHHTAVNAYTLLPHQLHLIPSTLTHLPTTLQRSSCRLRRKLPCPPL